MTRDGSDRRRGERKPFGQQGWQTWMLAGVLVIALILLAAVYQAQ